MDWNDDVAANIVGAWRAFMDSKYAYLVRERAREEAVTGAFWPFLEPLCPDGFVINIEYDKMNNELRQRAEKQIMVGGDIHAVLPDIIIHCPGVDEKDGNLLAIEMKKWRNGAWPHDVEKLREMTSAPRYGRRFQYQFGLLIRFRPTGAIGAAVLFEEDSEFELNPVDFCKR